MGSFAVLLSETAPTWGRAVAPFAEWVASTLWSRTTKSPRDLAPATRLTQRRRREVKRSMALPPTTPSRDHGPSVAFVARPSRAWEKLLHVMRPCADDFEV